MFVALLEDDKSRIEATTAVRELRHLCPRCSENTILVRGKKNRAHFRHPKDTSCPNGVRESWQHEQAKAAILEGARFRGLIALPEQEVLSIDGDRRADVVILAPQTDPPVDDSKRRLAFEVQYSAISCDDLITRTYAYMNAIVPVIWIPVIDQSVLRSIQMVNETNLFLVRGYSAPTWIEDIARLHKKLWIYIPQTNGFWRGWLLPNWRYKNPSDSYYDSDGQHHSGGGGYWYHAAKKRDLYLEGPYSFAELNIVRINHSRNQMVSPKGERRFLVELLPSGNETLLECPIAQRKRPHIYRGKETGFFDYIECFSNDTDNTLVTFTEDIILPQL
jgi:Competence protein CoiA-like family